MLVTRAAAATSLLAGLALGEAFTTIDPCPIAPKNITKLHESITVTAQHQAVTTCAQSASGYGWNTYNWVSTVIPCWGESSISSCTVTDANQVVPCTGSATTITSKVPTSTAKPNGTYETWTVTNYETVSKLWVAPYNKLGPLAIPGFAGCDLCEDCGAKEDGSKNQNLNVTECTSVAGKAPVCSRFADIWTSKSAPSTTGPATAAVSTHTNIPSRGVYTFYFPQQAPSTTIKSNNQVYTVPAKPWTAAVTQTFSGPTNVDITVTVTKTVTFNFPYSSIRNPRKTDAPEGFKFPHVWGPWRQGQDSKPTGKPQDPHRQWADWNSLWQSRQSSTATTTQAGKSSSWDPKSPPYTQATGTSKQDGGSGWQEWETSAAATTTTVTVSTVSTSTTTYTASTTTSYGHPGDSTTTTASGTTSSTTSTTNGFPGSTSTTGYTTSTSTTTNGYPDSTTTSISGTTLSTTTTGYTTSTTTSVVPPVETTTFYIEVTYSGLRRRYTKRGDTTWIGFLDGSDDGSLVTENPTKFFFDTEGNLRTGSQYISADSSSGYFVFEKSDNKPSTSRSYSLSPDGTFSPPPGGAFCATPSNFFVTFGSSPSNCKAVSCKSSGDGNPHTTTTSTSYTTTTTTEYTTTTTTTTTADVSGDAAVPDPTHYVRRSARY